MNTISCSSLRALGQGMNAEFYLFGCIVLFFIPEYYVQCHEAPCDAFLPFPSHYVPGRPHLTAVLVRDYWCSQEGGTV
jgi:hypothetical protein